MSDQREPKIDSNAQMSDEALALRAIAAYLGQIIFAERLARIEQEDPKRTIQELKKENLVREEEKLVSKLAAIAAQIYEQQSIQQLEEGKIDSIFAYIAAGRLNDARLALTRLGPSDDKLVPIAWIRLSIAALAKRAQFTLLKSANMAASRSLEDEVRQVLEIAACWALEELSPVSVDMHTSHQILGSNSNAQPVETPNAQPVETPALLLRLGANLLADQKLSGAHWALESALKAAHNQNVYLPELSLLLSILGIAAREQQATGVALWATEQAVREAERGHLPFLGLTLLGRCIALALNQEDGAAIKALQRAERELWFLLPIEQLVKALASLNQFAALIAQHDEKQQAVQALQQVERVVLRTVLEARCDQLSLFTQLCLYRILGEAPKQPAQCIHLCRAFLEEMYFAGLPRLQVPASALSAVIGLLEASTLDAEPVGRACLGLAYLARAMACQSLDGEDSRKAIAWMQSKTLMMPEVSVGLGLALRTNNSGSNIARQVLQHALMAALPGTVMHAWSVIELANAPDSNQVLEGLDRVIEEAIKHFEDDYFLLGHAYLAYGELDKAIEAFAKANNLAGQGYAYLARYERAANDNDLNEAIQHLEQAKEQAGDASPERGPILASLGRACLADYKRSAKGEQLDRAIAYLEGSPLREEAPEVLNDLGEALLCLFERNGRLEVLERAMAYLRRALMLAPPGLPLRATVLNNLGRAHLARHERLGDKADLEQADHAFYEALRTEEAYEATLTTREVLRIAEIVELEPRPVSAYVAVCRLNRARLCLRRFQRTGQKTDIDSAIQYLQEALELVRSGRVKDVPRLSLAHFIIGWLGLNDSQTNKIVPIIQNSLGEAYLARHRAISNESDLQAAFSQLEAAKQAVCPKEIEQKIAILCQSVSDDLPRFSEQSPALLPAILNNLGKAHLRARQPKEALAHLSVARALVSDTFHPERAESLNYLGLTWWALGNEARAIKAWEEGQAALRHIISTEPETQALAGLNAQITRQLVSAHYKKGDPRAALSALERGRTVRSQAELARARYVLNGKQQGDQNVFLYKQFAEIAAERRLLFYDYISGGKHLDERMAALAEQHKRIVEQIKAQDASLSADQIETLAKKHGVTLIVLYPLDVEDLGLSATLAFVITPEQGLSCHALPLTRQGLHKLIFDKDAAHPGWLPAYQASFAGDEQTWQQTINRVLRELKDSLLAPLHRILVNELKVAEGSSIVIVPCEHLSLLPLHAAPIDDERCFGDAFVVSYAPSATALFARADKQTANAQGDPQFVAVVNPDGSLVFAESEVEGIPGTLAKGQAVAYGPDANLKWLLHKAAEADYLHLATHGDFASGWPERSTLLLAHPKGYTEPLRQAGLWGAHLSRAELQDGCEALTLNDLWASRLQLKPGCLVVLSACETGQIEPGDVVDEVLGFPAALLTAGARGVVASLWAVDDLSTSLLMQKMYQEMASGKRPEAALQAASSYLRSLSQDQIQAALTSEIQRLQKDYQGGKWKKLSLPDQARMFYRITNLQLMHPGAQRRYLSETYYWSPFLYYCTI